MSSSLVYPEPPMRLSHGIHIRVLQRSGNRFTSRQVIGVQKRLVLRHLKRGEDAKGLESCTSWLDRLVRTLTVLNERQGHRENTVALSDCDFGLNTVGSPDIALLAMNFLRKSI